MERGGREVGGRGVCCASREERCTFSTYPPRPNLQVAAEHTFQCPAAQGWRTLEPQGSSRIAWLSVGARRRQGPSRSRQRVPATWAAAAGVRLFDPRNSLHRQSSRRCQVDTLLA